MSKCKFVPIDGMIECGRVELHLPSFLTIGGQFRKPAVSSTGKMPLLFIEDEEYLCRDSNHNSLVLQPLW
jgi:hypothetical protein